MKLRFSLRQTTLLVITTVVFGLTTVLLFTVRSTLQNQLREQEQHEVTVNVQRAAALLQSRIAAVEASAQALTLLSLPASPAALAEEFTPARMESLGLDAVVFTRVDGSVIFERGYDLQTNVETSVPSELSVMHSAPAVSMILAKGAHSGLLAAPDGPLLAAVVPWAFRHRSLPAGRAGSRPALHGGRPGGCFKPAAYRPAPCSGSG